PEMEWCGRDFESEANSDHDDGNEEQRVQMWSADCRRDVGEFDGAGESIEQAHAEEQESGGHAAEEEVFEGRFGGLAALLVESGEDVEREREEFERHEDEQEILRRDQEHHGHGGEQDDRDVFADVPGEARGCGKYERERSEDQNSNLDDSGEWRNQQHAIRQAGEE